MLLLLLLVRTLIEEIYTLLANCRLAVAIATATATAALHQQIYLCLLDRYDGGIEEAAVADDKKIISLPSSPSHQQQPNDRHCPKQLTVMEEGKEGENQLQKKEENGKRK